MNIKEFIQDLLAVGNVYNPKSYLEKWHKTAVECHITRVYLLQTRGRALYEAERENR